MIRWWKHWRPMALVALVGAIAVVAWWPASIEVDTASVERRPLQVTLDEEGATRVRERFIISSPVNGRVERITLEPGDTLKRGETVLARISAVPPALIDPRSQAEMNAAVEAATAAVGLAQAERQRAAATLTRAQAAERRQRELVEAGAISREEHEVAQTALRVAEEGMRATDFAAARADFERQQARARLTQPGASGRALTLRSPIDGVVLRRLRESEGTVPAGEPLLEIGDPAGLEIVADYLSADAVRMTTGARVLVDRWGGTGTLDGRVRRIEPTGFTKVSALGVEEQRVNVHIDFVDRAAARPFGDGYRVEVRVVIWEQAQATVVPIGALFRQGDRWAAFALDNGVARRRDVVVGERNAQYAEVREGLREGETVVLHPPDTLTEGSRLTVRGAAP